jgi:predicted RND superfamily exporter protein
MVAHPFVALYLRALDFPRVCLAVIALFAVIAGVYTQRFSFDASSDTLVVDGDPDLAAYIDVAATFKGDDFLVLTFAPYEGEALSTENLATLRMLVARLAEIDNVAGIFSVLDVPLLKSPPVPLAELAEGFKTLDHPEVDLQLAREELSGSPLFRELLITADARTTAIRIDIEPDLELLDVEARRAALKAVTDPTPAQRFARSQVDEEHRLAREAYLVRRDKLIADIREVRADFTDHGVLYLGGVPMIAADMIAFVKNDLVIFGASVLLLLMASLYGFFRSIRWVVLPVTGSALTILLTTGFLGFYGKPATVISSNFVSLLAIITISLNIHLIVRYRELFHLDPEMSVRDLVRQTMLSKFAPCLYNTLTTMAAFGSLMASSIVPVEDFGWMMVIGILIGFVLTFFYYPCVLMLLPMGNPGITLNEELALTRVLSHNARWRPSLVVVAGLALSVVAFYGVSRVSLDNRFIDYFKDDTEISAGMRFIDESLGGTVPFDVVLTFPAHEPLTGEGVFDDEDDFAEAPMDDEFIDDFAEFPDQQVDAFPERYWFTRDKLDRVTHVHRYMESRPEIGKVMSLTTMEDLAKEFTDGEPLSNLEIAGILGLLPPDLLPELVGPYAHPESGRLRINARVIESGPSFDRDALVNDIRTHAMEVGGFSEDEVAVTGMLVLFNSMLNQLFSSQVDTLAYVLLATFSMFLILMRSFLYAVLGLLPNILAASLVIAFMGYAGIPLDMMTITIASISIGIGVDDAIHYLHRFKEEYDENGDARLAVAWSHATIGRAMYFTSLTIIIGFSVLCFSNFVPTILFGLLVAVAMILALVANLSLLPALLVLCKGSRRAVPAI